MRRRRVPVPVVEHHLERESPTAAQVTNFSTVWIPDERAGLVDQRAWQIAVVDAAQVALHRGAILLVDFIEPNARTAVVQPGIVASVLVEDVIPVRVEGLLEKPLEHARVIEGIGDPSP
jgi:hypothetical protein